LPFCHVTLRGQKPPPPGYPRDPNTLGEWVKKRRLDLGLLQRQVAEMMGVDVTTVKNWELNHHQPALRQLPAIVSFLGDVPRGVPPFPAGDSPQDRIHRYQLPSGHSRSQLGRQLHAEVSTLWRWEHRQSASLRCYSTWG
jgi:transcriptional regulator with XRE-family HTH domain